jgi:hypothetical protein
MPHKACRWCSWMPTKQQCIGSAARLANRRHSGHLHARQRQCIADRHLSKKWCMCLDPTSAPATISVGVLLPLVQ